MSINASSPLSNLNNNTGKEKENLTPDGYVPSVQGYFIRAEVITSGPNETEPDPENPGRYIKPFQLEVYLVGEVERGGRIFPDRKVIKVTSEIEPPAPGVYTLLVDQGKYKGNQWYSLVGVLEGKLSVDDSMRKIKMPVKKVKIKVKK